MKKILFVIASIFSCGLIQLFEYLERRKQRKGWEFIKSLYEHNNQRLPLEVDEALKYWKK
jgi:hypothetical protein